jgi:hypothetical protein
MRLDDEDWEEQLQQALRALPPEQAPSRLRRRLRNIPWRQRLRWRPGVAGVGLQRAGPRWGLALSLALLGGLVFFQLERREAAQVAQARSDIAVALAYLDRASQLAGQHASGALRHGLARPVAQHTINTLQQPLAISLEDSL